MHVRWKLIFEIEAGQGEFEQIHIKYLPSLITFVKFC